MSDLEVSDGSPPPHASPQHCVGTNETLVGVAIKYDTSTGELMRLNRLSSHSLFPGQKLRVPMPDALPDISCVKKTVTSPSLPISKPDKRTHHSHTFNSQFSSFEEISLPKTSELDLHFLNNSLPCASPGDELTNILIRIRAKYITLDKGCARGKLHLTPQSFIFEPDSSDQVVELQGHDQFAVILPMQSISDLKVTSDFTKFLGAKTTVSSPVKIPDKGAKFRPPTKEPAFSSPDPSDRSPLSPQDSTESEWRDIAQPMFLRLTTLHTPLDTFDSPPPSLFARLTRPRGASSETEIQALKRAKSRSEYWFAIPHSRADSLYAFFLQWNPSAQDSRQESRPGKLEDQRSFSLHFKENHITATSVSPPSQSWAVLPSVDTIRETNHRAAVDACPLPKLVGTASLLDQRLLRELNYLLPSRTVGHDLWLVYSSFVHGISLRTMYRNMEGCTGPILFVLRDNQQWVFGGVVSCPLRVSEHYYGTGESFMFRVERQSQKVQPFYWTGCNTFIVKGDDDSISFGGGNGKPALWLDGDFYNGSSFPCNTFDNSQLSCSEDFLCTGFESWGFVEWKS